MQPSHEDFSAKVKATVLWKQLKQNLYQQLMKYFWQAQPVCAVQGELQRRVLLVAAGQLQQRPVVASRPAEDPQRHRWDWLVWMTSCSVKKSSLVRFVLFKKIT